MADRTTDKYVPPEPPAFPNHELSTWPGLTKRELFAAMAMQGWLAGCRNAYGEFTAPGDQMQPMANGCVKFADALIAALEVPRG